jgi:hypothetical protein
LGRRNETDSVTYVRYLHFTDNRDKPDKRDDNSDRLWKIRTIFDMLSNVYAKYYGPTEHSAVDEITVLFKGRVDSIFPRNTNALE